jgi:hypothetical protein
MDQGEALSLVQLICDIEPAKRNSEFFLVYRKDTAPYIAKAFERTAGSKFATAVARAARNHDTGWPAGSNMLAASAFIELTLLVREGLCKSEAFLLFEPDCVPMRKDWIDQLAAEWEKTKAEGKEAFGHWHQQAGPDTLHMNGNAVFRADYFDRHSNLIVGAGTQGWDYFFREQILPISRDSDLIFQHYNRHGLTREEWDSTLKNGQKPALFHGIKTPHGRVLAREILVTS